ncbi:glycoside hydrolase family 13 protein [Cellulomonas marina]|uniref:Oligo-1,6-glucosidase n=1 Tax=Cellulomonas marina TaxID=988821 RepID=A0A1I0WP76_9CELL|nr:alpha-glucosidase [Cellulomonas marina]GIG27790.1 glucohydrolase [Cellulomonas marina]SFA90575.1 oligo-1,6-glucosidase [Cellulomonas marina]
MTTSTSATSTPSTSAGPSATAAAPAWWTSATVYQVYPRSFADSDGDGVGDIPGIRAHVDHLAALGVDVVWLSPVYATPQDDNGYDISDYRAVDPTFGTLEDLDGLIADLHDRGIRLVMDLVVNHTSDEHAWFVESRSSSDNPKRDWYWWRPARAGMEAGAPGAEPTNWGSFFSGPAWELDQATGEYYLHLFSRKQPDLNWENPQVREAVYDMMRWWLDRGVDGFRMDVINLISKRVGDDGSLTDGPVGGNGPYGDGSAEYVCGPRIHEFLAEMHREVFAGREADLITVGEMPGVTVDDARLFTDPARAEVDMVFQFEHVGLDHGPGGKFDVRPLRLTDLKASFGRWQAGLADVGWNSLYWDNHDQPRAVSRFGDDSPEHRERSAACLATLLHLHRGTPYVYQGEELGMTNAPLERIEDFRDIESLNHFRQAVDAGADPDDVLVGLRAMGRDNARTPMHWDGSDHAGFTTGEPWIAVQPNHDAVNAEAARADEHSVFHHYRRLIAQRHAEPVVALGDFTMLLLDDEQVYAFTRTLTTDAGDETVLVVANVSSSPARAAVPDAAAWADAERLEGCTYRPDEGSAPDADAALAAGALALRPWEALVLRRRG